jgi:hypothetical protein
MGQQALFRIDHGDAGFVTGTFKTNDIHAASLQPAAKAT